MVAELLADLRVPGGGVQRPGRGAAGVRGEDDGGEIADLRRVHREDAVRGDPHLVRPDLRGRPRRIGALVRPDDEVGGVHGQPEGGVGHSPSARLRGGAGRHRPARLRAPAVPVAPDRRQHQHVSVRAGQHGRRRPVEHVSAVHRSGGQGA